MQHPGSIQPVVYKESQIQDFRETNIATCHTTHIPSITRKHKYMFMLTKKGKKKKRQKILHSVSLDVNAASRATPTLCPSITPIGQNTRIHLNDLMKSQPHKPPSQPPIVLLLGRRPPTAPKTVRVLQRGPGIRIPSPDVLRKFGRVDKTAGTPPTVTPTTALNPLRSAASLRRRLSRHTRRVHHRLIPKTSILSLQLKSPSHNRRVAT